MNKLLYLTYICLIYILYIVTKKHYDVEGTTITVKNLDDPIDISSLEDLGIVPVFNKDEYSLIKPMEEIIQGGRAEHINSFYVELDGKYRVSAISPWDSFVSFTGDPMHRVIWPGSTADEPRLSQITPQKQLEYGKIVGLDDTKVIHYDKRDITTLDTTPSEVGSINDIFKHVKPSLAKFYKQGLPDTFVVSVDKLNLSKFKTWDQSGVFHQDLNSPATLLRPYTKARAKYVPRDIRMVIIPPDAYDEQSITQFAKSINGGKPSHELMDQQIYGKSATTPTGPRIGHPSEVDIDIIKIDKGSKPLIGILFDNHKIFHATPSTSLSLLEFMFKKSKMRKVYQITFSDGFFGPMTAAKKKKKKKKKKSKSKSKSKNKSKGKTKKKEKKYKVIFEN